MAKNELYQLRQKQSLPLEAKIEMSKARIREFYEQSDGKVSISFSGGKDSTVLLDLVRSIYPEVKAVFVDTGLEYPEIKDFVKTFENVEIVRPEMSFKEVIDVYGYPVVSKKTAGMIGYLQNPTEKNEATRQLCLTGINRSGKKSPNSKLAKKWYKLIDAPFKVSDKCCVIMKKKPLHKYEKETGNKPFIGTMASDSERRITAYLKNGCIIPDKSCQPLGFWLEEDIWEYIRSKNIAYCSIYDTGIRHTGCMFCMFGVHLEKGGNRFQNMKKTHPQIYKYCMEHLVIADVLDYIDVKY